MPRTKKPTAQAVDKRNGRRVEIASTRLEEFDCPPRLSSAARDAWSDYWADSVSSAPTVADRALLLRWVHSLNRFVVYSHAVDEEPLTLGAAGQRVVNPLAKLADSALVALERCERQLGIGARNRADLGLAMVSEQKTLKDLNAHFEQPSHLSVVAIDDHDPRLDRDPSV